ncbi:class I SAM-dependent methyltransferase [Corynebacterium felinum]|uniref:Trans-aconitate methyltransferase n=2 Tax=Corynebacterium felinum TaxID=131318 RepID=A0ABU2B9W3_9CORY|nr:class I SAM-dependent methyltransferase [Corynebacterium felinum]MDF5821782.1 class I SAM-dependent methyltransferase [Corynebacterium felinum]MDR7355411.1 trans-aconitate methyltransferase [Corynebacterium felinum]
MHDMYEHSTENIWSGEPNHALTIHAEHVTARTALDIGAGEGADADWLHTRGITVTAVEPSPTAAQRIRELNPDINVIEATFDKAPLTSYDLVIAFYTPLLADAATLTALINTVNPGGTLLVVHHTDISRMAEHHQRPIGDFLTPDKLKNLLPDDFHIDYFGEAKRTINGGQGAAHTHDLVIKAQRT